MKRSRPAPPGGAVLPTRSGFSAWALWGGVLFGGLALGGGATWIWLRPEPSPSMAAAPPATAEPLAHPALRSQLAQGRVESAEGPAVSALPAAVHSGPMANEPVAGPSEGPGAAAPAEAALLPHRPTQAVGMLPAKAQNLPPEGGSDAALTPPATGPQQEGKRYNSRWMDEPAADAPSACPSCGRVVSVSPVSLSAVPPGAALAAGAAAGAALGAGGGSAWAGAAAAAGATVGAQVESEAWRSTGYLHRVQLDGGGEVRVILARPMPEGLRVVVEGASLRALREEVSAPAPRGKVYSTSP